MIADIGTKALSPAIFHRLRAYLLGYEPLSTTSLCMLLTILTFQLVLFLLFLQLNILHFGVKFCSFPIPTHSDKTLKWCIDVYSIWLISYSITLYI